MTRVEKTVQRLKGELSGKEVLEVACGCAEFSICASQFVKTVYCIDLDRKRLLETAADCSNLVFCEMDATAMLFGDNSFDTVILYNAAAHLKHVLDRTVTECLRVLKKDGNIYIISSFRMDKQVIFDDLLPLLERENIPCRVQEDKIFHYVQIRKTSDAEE